MGRGYRYWGRNAVSMLGMMLAGSAGITLFYAVMDRTLDNIWIFQVLIFIFLGIWFLAEAARAGRVLSVGVMFSMTRNGSFRGMQFMLILGLLLTELVQLLMLPLPFEYPVVQRLVVYYTPAVGLFLGGIGYFTALVEKHSRKLYTVFITGLFILAGTCAGFIGAILAGESGLVGNHFQKRGEMLEGKTAVIALAVSAAVYVTGAWRYERAFRDMDITV